MTQDTHTSFPLPHSSSAPTIIFLHADSVNGLGDNVIALDTLLALKRIYQARLVVFARDILQELLLGLGIVDEFCLLEGELATATNREKINAHNATYLLSLSCKAHQLAFFASTNVATIITRAKLANIFRKRFRPVLVLNPRITHRQTLLLLARNIDKARFDTHIDSINFLESRVKSSDYQKQEIAAFLATELTRFGRSDFNANATLQDKVAFTKAHRASLSSKASTQNPLALSLSSSQTPLYLVCINPFSIAATHNLHLEGYLTLIDRVAALPNCIPCICTYGKAHAQLQEALQDYNAKHKTTLQDTCIIYHNRGDLHNLAAFLESMSCIITGSTGALHLSENLFIPSIALVSRKDTKRWGSQDKRYILIPQALPLITQAQESSIIDSTIAQLQALLAQQDYCHDR